MMMRNLICITALILLTSVVLADENLIINDTPDSIDVNMTNMTGVGNYSPEAGNFTAAEKLIQTNETAYANQTSVEENVTPQMTPEKPVYTRSIGSVYSADYQEPQPRTFSYSGCGT
jgi:hypothetical protein